MKYVINADEHSINVTVYDDPQMAEPMYSYSWSKAQFENLTGIKVKNNVKFAMEPHRSIFAVIVDEDVQMYKNVKDHKLLLSVWDKRDLIRMHTKAAIQEKMDGLHFYDYDPKTDKIIKTERPEKPHLEAAKMMGGKPWGERVVIDLIELLISKGLITERDLSQFTRSHKNKIRKAVDNIDWS